MKPYYEHGGITIYHGDCRDILPGFDAADVVVTDPPYGIGKDATDMFLGVGHQEDAMHFLNNYKIGII